MESDLEVFEMKQEIVSLQTKIEDSESENLMIKHVIGKGWRNSVMQRRIYGRLTSENTSLLCSVKIILTMKVDKVRKEGGRRLGEADEANSG